MEKFSSHCISADGKQISVTLSRNGDYRLFPDWRCIKNAKNNARERGVSLVARCDGSAILFWRDMAGKIRQKTFRSGSTHFSWLG